MTDSCPLGLDPTGNCTLPLSSSLPTSSLSDTPLATPLPSTPAPPSMPLNRLCRHCHPTYPQQVFQSGAPLLHPPSNSLTTLPVVCLDPWIVVNGICILPPPTSQPSPPATSAPLPSLLPQPSNPPTPSPMVCLGPSIIINGVCILGTSWVIIRMAAWGPILPAYHDAITPSRALA